MQCLKKPLVVVATAYSKRQWKDKRHHHSPQPYCDGGDQRSAFSHYGVISQGELDGDETVHADQREVKDDGRNEQEIKRGTW